MIIYKQVDPSYFNQYDQVPMRLMVTTCYQIDKINRGLGGIHLVETTVEPYLKDFCTGEDESVTRWAKHFDVGNWAFFMAFDDERPIGAATIASRTKGVNLLEGRDDLAVLWDLRVDDDYKGLGIGQGLFDEAIKWSRLKGMTQLKIECQNNNVPAVKFYHKQGATLSAYNEYAYYSDPEFKHEIQLIWYLSL